MDSASGSSGGGGNGGVAQRIQAVACGAIAALPPMQRQRAERQLHDDGLALLTQAMSAWAQGSRLDPARFAAHFFGRSGFDPVPAQLRAVALRVRLTSDPATLADASHPLAETMQQVRA